MRREFIVGFGKVDITPPLSIPYLDFCPNRHNFFTGIHDTLYSRALYLSSGDEEAIIIATDTIGFSKSVLGEKRDFIKEIKEMIEEKTGVPQSNIMLTSSHIHSTPDTLNFRPLIKAPNAKEWLEDLQRRIILSAETALNGRFMASLKVGSGEVNVSKNRRGEEFLDREVIVIIFESARRDKIFLVNFACHPVIVQAQNLVSADYVGVVENKIEEFVSNTRGCIFLQGACGDINPICDDTRDFNDVYSIGISIAGEIMKIYGEISISKSNHPIEPVILKVRSKEVGFPSRPLPSQAEIEELIREKEEEEIKVKYVESENEKNQALKKICRIEDILARIEEGNGPFIGELQMIRVGNCILFGIPGEPFCELGMKIKAASKPFRGIPIGYANGYLGYIAPLSSWRKGGYEVSLGPWSKVGPEAFDKIIEVFHELKENIII
jgi:hypothetical protein